MTTNYLVHQGDKQIARVANKTRAIKTADAAHAADKRTGVTVTIEKSGTVVHTHAAETAKPKPAKTTKPAPAVPAQARPSGPRVDASTMDVAPPNVKGYVYNPADNHGTVATYGKGCRCITPIVHEGRTLYGCLGATHEYDRWWRNRQTAKRAGTDALAAYDVEHPRPTFPKASRAAADAKVTGAARAEALADRLTTTKAAAAG